MCHCYSPIDFCSYICETWVGCSFFHLNCYFPKCSLYMAVKWVLLTFIKFKKKKKRRIGQKNILLSESCSISVACNNTWLALQVSWSSWHLNFLVKNKQEKTSLFLDQKPSYNPDKSAKQNKDERSVILLFAVWTDWNLSKKTNTKPEKENQLLAKQVRLE